MAYTLSEAANACGRGKTTILRMIKAGKLSAARDPVTGGWMVEPVELHRLYRPARHEAKNSAHHSTPRIAELETRVSEKDVLIAVHERTIDDLRRRLDQSDEERRRLTLLLADQRQAPAPTPAATPAMAPNRVRGWRFWRQKSNSG